MIQFEITAELAIEVPQHVEIEASGNTGAVVIGVVDDSRVFLEVNADQECAAVTCFLVHDTQQFHSVVVLEIANR